MAGSWVLNAGSGAGSPGGQQRVPTNPHLADPIPCTKLTSNQKYGDEQRKNLATKPVAKYWAPAIPHVSLSLIPWYLI